MSSASRPPGRQSKYVDIDRLENANNIVAIVSQRVKTGELTFAIFREFERDDGKERTGFVPEWLGQSYLDMVTLALERIAKIKETGMVGEKPVPYPIGGPGRRDYRGSNGKGRHP